MTEIPVLLTLLDEAFDKQSWHGPNLRGALRGLSAEQAAWRPDPARHNIWELMMHAAYWKCVARRRITGEKGGSFALAGSNWFARPEERGGAAWKKDRALLVAEHQALRQAIAALRDSDRRDRRRWEARLRLIRGVAAHDLYHAGQIQLLRRLSPPRSC